MAEKCVLNSFFAKKEKKCEITVDAMRALWYVINRRKTKKRCQETPASSCVDKSIG